jgi:hypothetical protein
MENDAVLSALGHAKGSPDYVLAQASSNLISAISAMGVNRLVVLSSPAVADASDRPGLFYQTARVPSVVCDHREQARLID